MILHQRNTNKRYILLKGIHMSSFQYKHLLYFQERVYVAPAY
jgi:hypothetical protein